MFLSVAIAKFQPAAVLLFFTLWASVCLGQSVQQGDLEACAAEQTPELRLACFELLATGNSQAPGESSATAKVPVEGENLAADATKVAPLTTTDSRKNTSRTTSDNGLAADVPNDHAESASSQHDGSAEIIAPTSQPQRDRAADFGSEQLQSDSGTDKLDESITATVVDVSEGRYKVLYFRLANGQRWRQIEGRRFRYPKNQEFDVIITKGVMGDYRLRLDESSPMTRIRRIE